MYLSKFYYRHFFAVVFNHFLYIKHDFCQFYVPQIISHWLESKLCQFHTISIYEILEKSSHENHDDWTQLQVVRADSGRSCVSLSRAAFILSSLLALHPLSPTFSFPSTGVGTRSAYVVYKLACFLAGVYTHFPPSFLSAPLRNTAATLVRVSLHPPAPKGN